MTDLLETALECPACHLDRLVQQRAGALSCPSCAHSIALSDGIYALAPDIADTQLDTADYMSANYPTERSYKNHYRDLEALLKTVLAPGEIGHALEVGSGSGAWTWGLSRDPRVKTLYASDISPAFLTHLAQTSAGPGTLILKAGGEDLSFAPGSLNLVLGRSVLHHIYDYRAVLAQMRTWLKPGGTAIFFEPNLQGKLWIAFYIEMIRRMDLTVDSKAERLVRRSPKGFSAATRKRMQGATRHILKDFYHPDIDSIRASIEDKYVFDIDTLIEDGRAAGFSDVSYVDQNQGNGLALKRIRNNIEAVMGADKDKIALYAPLFDAFEATFGLGPRTTPISPMGYFVFRA